jgi:hypothetical protein
LENTPFWSKWMDFLRWRGGKISETLAKIGGKENGIENA